MTFVIGGASRAKLQGVHPQLVKVVELAITYTPIDFGVHDGLRSIETQREYVRRGVSKTMDSKHLAQADGFSHAVDLVPYIAGQLRWEWQPIYMIGQAVLRSARELGVLLTWGGVWDRVSSALPQSAESLKREVAAYCVRHPGDDFIDGPHWQLYP